MTALGWKALLEWTNDLLKIQMTQIEQCASGAVYCQILDLCYPDTVEMSKVNWMAKAEHEYLPNYKILQTAFDANGISKPFPVGELIRGKFRDNFEMLQWMKALWDRLGTRNAREPSKSREGKQLPSWAGGLQSGTTTPRATSRQRDRPKAVPTPCRSLERVIAKVETWRSQEAPPRSLSASRSRSPSQEPHLLQKLAAQEDEIHLLRQERDFYFEKLQNAEKLYKKVEASDDVKTSDVLEQLQQILYKENDDLVGTSTAEGVLPHSAAMICAAID